MKRFALAGVVLLAACGGTQVVETTTVPPTTTTTVTTTTTTTTVPAPTTTVDFDEMVQMIAIADTFTATVRVDLCLSMLKARDGGLPSALIIQMGIDSFAEGFGDLRPGAEDLLRTILEDCLS